MKYGGHIARKETISELYNVINGNLNYRNGKLVILESTKDVAAREIKRRKNAVERDINRLF